MILDEKMSIVVAELEYIIGSECYNPNSYDGWNDIEGCSFRYPINIPNNIGEYTKTRDNINKSYLVEKKDVNPDTVPYMKYKFGSNELYIGKGLIHLLNYLEERYNINFNELEEKIKKNNSF